MIYIFRYGIERDDRGRGSRIIGTVFSVERVEIIRIRTLLFAF